MTAGGYKAVIRAQRKLAEAADRDRRGVLIKTVDRTPELAGHLAGQVVQLTTERDGLLSDLAEERKANQWLLLRLVSQKAASLLAVERMQVDGAAAKQARKERDVFERAAVQLQDHPRDRFTAIVGGHTDPADCPTYYDGCNCSVEVLIHNINRAEKAEHHLAVTREQLERARRVAPE